MLAYKSDGTPMYSQSEVDNYLSNKYGGQVNYHIQDNGYISLDEPSYTNDGRRVDYDYGGSSESGGTPTPTPTPAATA